MINNLLPTLRESVTKGRSCTRLTCWSSQLELVLDRSSMLLLLTFLKHFIPSTSLPYIREFTDRKMSEGASSFLRRSSTSNSAECMRSCACGKVPGEASVRPQSPSLCWVESCWTCRRAGSENRRCPSAAPGWSSSASRSPCWGSRCPAGAARYGRQPSSVDRLCLSSSNSPINSGPNSSTSKSSHLLTLSKNFYPQKHFSCFLIWFSSLADWTLR